MGHISNRQLNLTLVLLQLQLFEARRGIKIKQTISKQPNIFLSR